MWKNKPAGSNDFMVLIVWYLFWELASTQKNLEPSPFPLYLHFSSIVSLDTQKIYQCDWNLLLWLHFFILFPFFFFFDRSGRTALTGLVHFPSACDFWCPRQALLEQKCEVRLSREWGSCGNDESGCSSGLSIVSFIRSGEFNLLHSSFLKTRSSHMHCTFSII